MQVKLLNFTLTSCRKGGFNFSHSRNQFLMCLHRNRVDCESRFDNLYLWTKFSFKKAFSSSTVAYEEELRAGSPGLILTCCRLSQRLPVVRFFNLICKKIATIFGCGFVCCFTLRVLTTCKGFIKFKMSFCYILLL